MLYQCAICKKPFDMLDDYDKHVSETGHDQYIEWDKSEFLKARDQTAQYLEEYIKKGWVRYETDEKTGKLMVVRGPKFDEMLKESKNPKS